MDRDPDGTRLIGDGAGDRLSDPPSRIRGKLIPLGIIKLGYRLHQSQIALLNQIEEEKSLPDITLRNADDKTQIRLHKLPLRFFVALGHPFGKLRLAFGIEQRNTSDLLEVQLDGIVDRKAFLREDFFHVFRLIEIFKIGFDLVTEISDQIVVVEALGDIDPERIQRLVELVDLIDIVIRIAEHS